MLTLGETPTKEDFEAEFADASDGEVIFEGTHDGHRVSITKKDGKPVVEVKPTDVGEVRAAGVCHWAAMAAVFAIGSAGLAFMAASGGGVVAGVVLGARALQKLSAALAGGGGVSALVAAYIC